MELTHFRCDACSKVLPLKQRKIVKAAWTVFDHRSFDEFGCYHYHIQLCKKCIEKSGGK